MGAAAKAALNATPVWVLVLLWYASATVAVTSSREVLASTKLPFCLSAAQFLISTFLTRTFLRYALPWATDGRYRPQLRDLPSDRPERRLVRSIALTYTLGFVFTNVALSLCNPSFAETVKSAEPISSLALAALTRGEDAVSQSEWLTTLPIVCGVALSSYSDASFHPGGFLAAGVSNFMFSMRGLNTKQLRRLHGTPHGLDDLHLFYRISKLGAAGVLPLALLLEGKPLARLLLSTPNHFKAAQFAKQASEAAASAAANLETLREAAAEGLGFATVEAATAASAMPATAAVAPLAIVDSAIVNAALGSPNSTLLATREEEEAEEAGGARKVAAAAAAAAEEVEATIARAAALAAARGMRSDEIVTAEAAAFAAQQASEAAQAAAQAAALAHSGEMPFWTLVRCVALNGLCYCVYNQTSFVVLGRVSFVTHATLNVMRRVCIIAFTSWWFTAGMSFANALGVSFAILGFALFLGSKVRATQALSSLPR